MIIPAQILIGRNLQACPTKDTRVSGQKSRALTKRVQYYQKLVNGFWKLWNAEYLKSLTTLKRWNKIGREIRKGDLVLVSEDRVARGHSSRVEDTHTGRDGLVRSVTQRTFWKSYPVDQCSSYTCLKPVMLTKLLNLIELYETLLKNLIEFYNWTLLTSYM